MQLGQIKLKRTVYFYIKDLRCKFPYMMQQKYISIVFYLLRLNKFQYMTTWK